MPGSAPTLAPGDSSAVVHGPRDDELPALVIAWSDAEPDRVGEVALFDRDGGAQILGRGEGAGGRVRFCRQRPGVLEPAAPLASPGISREQLRVRLVGDRLHVERIGKCELVVRGEHVDRADIEPGEAILLRGQLVLYCTLRPRRIPALASSSLADAPRFGEPDAYGIVGESPAAWRLRDQLAWLGKADHHTLILGGSGSGKELCARAIHARSVRAAGPFVARNAATIPRDLVDAELFGNVRGYPNPGMPERPGLIGAAARGTLFLDELGELPHSLQANLLRVLDEDGEYHRLGAATASRSSFRLIGATNRELAALKHDLGARLVLRLEVPGVDDRRDDIPLLARHLLRRAAARSPEATARFGAARGARDLRIKARLIMHLLQVRYPTNLRELDAILWQAMAASPGDAITWRPGGPSAPLFAPPTERPTERPAERPIDPPAEPLINRPAARSPRACAPEPSQAQVRASLTEHRGNIARTAQALGLTSRYVLYRLMRKHGIGG
ncbi:MAG TPA: sigma 54-interacting transcriptional regulator [Kofleriaceae bacterium]|jgi:DNA-binding NtrC family response regulator|nr:sigma 54-interacting transcriptional regulator [Kofleriaceae bacterium]